MRPAVLALTLTLGLAALIGSGVAPTRSAERYAARAARQLAAWAAPDPAAPSAPPAQVVLTIDAERRLRPISPLIYGVSVADGAQLKATGAALNRWGGNPNTRYNWVLGTAWNAARDWLFANYGGQSTAPSSAADALVERARARGVQTVLTVPAIGWVARDGDNATRSEGVPSDGGPPLAPGVDAIAGYDPTANRARTSVPSAARKPGPLADPPDPTAPVVYQDEWVHHLVDRFGPAAAGGVGYYVVDNEPDLWASTHTDVHPVEPGYDDMLDTYVQYAEAIKDVDPSAQVLGPALSGWTALFYSARDRGQDRYRTHADRLAHGDMPFLPWWLEQVRRHDERVGRRTLDVLDVHSYPQAPGVFSGADDAATDRLRLRSTRALWDPTYIDESWIAEPVALIPRLRDWIDHAYPGTRLAINEWNWGADQTLNGALAIADVLGIYGREGVDMAAYWTSPPPDSPGAHAFSMYTNYDGAGHHFGDVAIASTSSAPNDVSVYGSLDSATGDVVVVLINKRDDATLPATVQVRGPVFGAAQVFRYSGADAAIQRDASIGVDGSQLSLTLPPASITLLRLVGSST